MATIRVRPMTLPELREHLATLPPDVAEALEQAIAAYYAERMINDAQHAEDQP
jgi:hypothetical protein